MYKGKQACLCMKKNMHKDKEVDNREYKCIVQEYNPTQECFYLQLLTGELTDIDLDGVYTCDIVDEIEQVSCSGNVVERFHAVPGKIVKFRIKNGFYKISVNKVDK